MPTAEASTHKPSPLDASASGLRACMRRFASDAAVIACFNRTYGTRLRAPIVELMSAGDAGALLDAPNGLQARQEVEMFAQFVLGVLWPRFQLQSASSCAPWAALADELRRRRAWARRAQPAG